MSSELVLYVISAARRALAHVDFTYDCTARVGEPCVLLSAVFEDGKRIQGAGCTIFGALRSLMVESKTEPDYFGDWKKLD